MERERIIIFATSYAMPEKLPIIERKIADEKINYTFCQ